jgi:hypothetical protein
MVKNFNRFTTLANQQRALAEKVAAFNHTDRLDRAEQLALRDLASEQKAIADELNLLSEKMRNDADIGREHFPKAAASSMAFAEAIELSRAPKLSQQATDAMLQSQGDHSATLAAATADAMESLIAQCNGGMGEMSQELDQQLSASRPSGGGAGQTFQQMLDNLKMRYSRSGQMSGIGKSGRGSAGTTGNYSVNTPEGPALLGNESLATEGDSSHPNDASGGDGQGDATHAEVINASGEPGTLSDLEQQRRKTDSVRAESLFIEHDSIVDAYFKKITKEQP